MIYKHGFLIVCLSTLVLIFFVLIYLSSEESSHPSYFDEELVEEDLPLEREKSLLGLPFNYLIYQPCPQNMTAIQIIHSFAGNVDARSAIRRAYPRKELELLGIRRFFLLSQLKPRQSDVTQRAILNESDRFGDIIQGDFRESYKNLTYKHVMGLRWASKCTVKYIIKMDDDILVDLYSLMSLIRTKDFDAMGYTLENMKPIRIRANKWYVRPAEYRKNSYPTFLSGWLYVIKPRVARRIVSLASRVPYFWIDDLFVTGILASQLHIKLTSINEYFTYHPELFECCIRDGVKCGFIIGPNGGDHSMQIRYMEHAVKCFLKKCKELQGNQTVETTCVSPRKPPPLGKGIPEFKVIKL